MAISTAVDASAVARVVGIKTEFKNLRKGSIVYLPQRIAVVGQGNTATVYDTTKRQVTSATEAASLYGYGSPIHLAVRQLLPSNGDGVGTIPVTIYPLDDDGSGVAATGDVTVTGTATEAGVFYVKVNNIRSGAIVVASGDAGTGLEDAVTDAINSVLEMPVTAVADGTGNKSDLTSKWMGESANDIYIEFEGSVAGLTLAATQMTGGLVNPSVQPALDQVGDVWESLVLNCLDIDDTTNLDRYQTFGEGRWGALVRKPLVTFTGINYITVASATAVSDARKTDRVNSQVPAPGSNDLPCVIAARQLARIAVLANNNPPVDYGSQPADGLIPGTDAQQWTYADRDSAVKKGSSTIEVRDGVVNLSDIVTMYHPAGDPTPAYRYVVDIVKIQQIIFNLDLIFATPEWDGAPLIPDDQPTVNRSAKKPKTAVAAVNAMLDNLALQAIISDPETWKSNTVAGINSSNPKRLDLLAEGPISGNANIISADLNFGFYFGTQPVVA